MRTDFEVPELDLWVAGCPEVDFDSLPDGCGVVELEGGLRVGDGRRVDGEVVGAEEAE